jgi:hypothetical protein
VLEGEIADRSQILALLTASARLGSVLASKTLLDELRRGGEDGSDAPSVIDELTKKRIKAAAEVRP